MATYSGAIRASLQSTCTKESGREMKKKHFFGDLNLESRGGEQALQNGRLGQQALQNGRLGRRKTGQRPLGAAESASPLGAASKAACHL